MKIQNASNRASRVFLLTVGLTAGLLLAVAAAGCRGAPDGVERRPLRVGDDLLAGAGRLVVHDSIAGDAMLVAGSVEFVGRADGDYLAAGGEQEIGGRVGGSVRAAGGRIALTAEVARNATLAGGQVEVGDGALIGGNVYLAGGQLSNMGTVSGSLRATGGGVIIDGPVGGDVRVEAGRLTVGPRARIEGDLSYRVPARNVAIDPAARIEGATVSIAPRRTGAAVFLLRVVWSLGFLLAGAVVVALLPRLALSAAEAVRRSPGPTVGLGFLWALLVPLFVVALAFTVIGIPLALILAAVYAISLYLGRAVVAVWLARALLGTRLPAGRGGLVLGFLAGGLILVLVRLVPLVGGLTMLVASIVGVGAVAMVVRERRSRPPAAGTAA